MELYFDYNFKYFRLSLTRDGRVVICYLKHRTAAKFPLYEKKGAIISVFQ